MTDTTATGDTWAWCQNWQRSHWREELVSLSPAQQTPQPVHYTQQWLLFTKTSHQHELRRLISMD